MSDDHQRIEVISGTARRHRLMTEGGAVAVRADDSMTENGDVRRLEERMRELERQLGGKTIEVEILKEALVKARAKNPTLLGMSPLRDGSK